jgi:hypothetical protein
MNDGFMLLALWKRRALERNSRLKYFNVKDDGKSVCYVAEDPRKELITIRPDSVDKIFDIASRAWYEPVVTFDLDRRSVSGLNLIRAYVTPYLREWFLSMSLDPVTSQPLKLEFKTKIMGAETDLEQLPPSNEWYEWPMFCVMRERAGHVTLQLEFELSEFTDLSGIRINISSLLHDSNRSKNPNLYKLDIVSAIQYVDGSGTENYCKAALFRTGGWSTRYSCSCSRWSARIPKLGIKRCPKFGLTDTAVLSKLSSREPRVDPKAFISPITLTPKTIPHKHGFRNRLWLMRSTMVNHQIGTRFLVPIMLLGFGLQCIKASGRVTTNIFLILALSQGYRPTFRLHPSSPRVRSGAT